MSKSELKRRCVQDPLTMAEEIDRLARLCEAKNAEIADARRHEQQTVEVAESFYQKLSEAQAQIAMQGEALEEIKSDLICNVDSFLEMHTVNMLDNAISATTETVAAWRAKETEPLRREVAMLRDVIERTSKEFRHGIHSADVSDLRTEALTNTKATALAYEREVRADERAYLAQCFREYDTGSIASAEQIARMLDGMAAELRASKGE